MTNETRDHLVICTLRYSDNLGDGVIGDTLAYIIGRAQPNVQITQLDMAGRTAFPVAGHQPSRFKNVYYLVPKYMRKFLILGAWSIFTKRKIKNAWKVTVPKGQFSLVFGGGQMLSDISLNFPLKFKLIGKLAFQSGALVAVNSVGVSSNWTGVGGGLFRSILNSSRVKWISVRDDQSRDNLRSQGVNGGDPGIFVSVDPAVWADEAYDVCRKLNQVKEIGLGLSHPKELALHANYSDAFQYPKMVQFWVELAIALIGRGYKPALFTNGAAEDQAFLVDVAKALDKRVRTGECKIYDQPLNPTQLVDTISCFDGVVSHRLHSNIIAFSLEIPTVSLVWDGKVKAFAQVAHRTKWCVDPGTSCAVVVKLLEDTMRVGVDVSHKNALKKRALNDTNSMLGVVMRAEF